MFGDYPIANINWPLATARSDCRNVHFLADSGRIADILQRGRNVCVGPKVALRLGGALQAAAATSQISVAGFGSSWPSICS
jgi:hypothetical protein